MHASTKGGASSDERRRRRARLENHRGQRIVTLADWERLAPPASARHWREYRSAFELAHSWTEGNGEERLAELLVTREEFADARVERAIAERKTFFDDIPGGPRNHDLLAVAPTSTGRLVIGIEAKADETFDRDLASFCAAARRRQVNTRAPERLDRLTDAFFGRTLDAEPTLGALRYQLLAALAGTLADAKRLKATAAVLVVHEYITPETDPTKQRRNARDLDAFVARLGAASRSSSSHGDWLAGPFAVPGNNHLPADIPIYVGKLRTTVERRTTSRSPLHNHPAPPNPNRGQGQSVPASRASRGNRGPVQIEIAPGARVFKLNRHPRRCPCGCSGNATIVLNRPGRNPRQNVRTPHLADAVQQVHDWALDAISGRDLGTQNPSSTFDVGGGMTTITLTVGPAGSTPRFSAKHWDTGQQHHSEELDTALESMRRWVLDVV